MITADVFISVKTPKAITPVAAKKGLDWIMTGTTASVNTSLF